MSYLVLARKSRPQDFNQVVGQKPVVKTLQNSLLRDRVAHAILFSGVRGVGKTTLARIMAKAINCQQRTDANPCNTCSSCVEITAGSALDLYEIDGASNRGIQEIRELKEKIRFLPTSSKYKIIIIDEVHMLTTEAFNALLKTLEEPPDHVFFMFATTELHKIPITILSRCQRYELKRVSTIDLGKHFQNLAGDEGITIDQAALDLIVREAEGSVRDGLSLLDQVFSYGEKEIGVNDVIQVLGLVSRDIILNLTRALLEKDPGTAFQALDNTFNFGVDLKRFTGDLLAAFRTLILCRINGCQDLIDIPQQELDLFKELAGKHSPESIHMKLNLLMQGVEEMRYSSQPRLALESTFLKIIQADDVVPVSSLLSKLDSLLEGKELPQKTVPPEPPEKKKSLELRKKPPGVSPAPEIPTEPPPPKTSPPVSNLADSTPPPAEEPPLPPEPEQPVSLHQDPKPIPHPHQRDVRRDWPGFIEHVKDRKVWMAQDLGRADKAREVGGELQLHFSDHANCAVLRQKQNIKLLTEFVLDFFQKDLKLHYITPDKEEGDTSDNADSPHKLRQKLANDPLVIMATEIFNGQIGDIRVGPRSR
ncbi:MAG: DNA polymerase III subunit gamma/tau [Desulfocapsa sp.]|nr:DNA polymerase III subunit gamma/tau [Desulfocapsa sp.]